MTGMSGSDDRHPGPDDGPVDRPDSESADGLTDRPDAATSPDPGPDLPPDAEPAERAGGAPVERDERPLSRLAERFRIPLGVLVAVIGLGLAVLFLTQPPELADGTRGTVEHVALVGLWVLIAAAGATYAFGAPRRVTNLCAAAGLAAYAVVWVSGL
jgi:hypothetical protein